MQTLGLDNKVRMKLIPQLKGPCRGRRGQQALTKKFTLVWCIEYETGGFFTFSYYRKQDAINAMKLMRQYGTDTVRYRDFNIVSDVDKTMHVFPKE